MLIFTTTEATDLVDVSCTDIILTPTTQLNEFMARSTIELVKTAILRPAMF